MPKGAFQLGEPAFRPYPLGAIKPSGWLERQLRIQADGLSGHLDEFWPDIQDSAWFGGQAEGWERAPYWLDGLFPLAYLLDDPGLKQKAVRYADAILTRQHEDGWLGPKQPNLVWQDIWSLFLILKALIQYYEASGDERVPEAMARCFRRIDLHIDTSPLFNWAQFRWFEALIPLYWLYERTGENWLLNLAVKLHAQGFDWVDFFEAWPMKEPTPKGRWNYMGHVVNNAMALKAGALWWSFTGKDKDRNSPLSMIELLDRYHGTAVGIFTGDECLAGRSPIQGTELCAVVEYLYSLETLISLLGDPSLGDRLEKIAFNALPATLSPDMRSHQYDQQVNQVLCSIDPGRPWTTNGPDSNLFGLEPNYGCCTANFSQGWPKFASHLWMRAPEGGSVAAAYAPSVLTTTVDRADVKLQMDTGYPFRDEIRIRVSASAPVRFPLLLRIPGWAGDATICVSGRSGFQRSKPGTFHRIERNWSGETEITIRFPMKPLLIHRDRGAVAIERGPLVYALKIEESWIQVNADKPGRGLPHADWEVHPESPWNYALDVREDTLEEDMEFADHAIGNIPFSPDLAAVRGTVKAKKVPGWKLENGSAGPVPESPVDSREPDETVTLIPYGCTNIRIAEFPVLARLEKE